MRSYLLLFFLLVFEYGSAQEYNYTYSNNCKEAYQYFLALQNTEGVEALDKEKESNPNNLLTLLIADYEDCLSLLFNGGEKEYDKRKPNMESRLSILNKGDKSSPWYKMCKAGIYMHWAFVAVRFDDKLKGGNYFRKSFLLLKENKQKFPEFKYDDIFFGVEEAAIGVLPDNYKWIASIFGMKGDLQKGAKRIKHFVDTHKPGDIFYNEAMIYSVYLNYFLLSDKEEAWRIVTSKNFDTKNNLLYSFVKANVALNYHKADSARHVLEQAKLNKYYKSYPSLEYEYAYSLLHSLDKRCIEVFKGFLNTYNGELFAKDALQKLAYANYIFGMPVTAMNYKEQIMQRGNTNMDADRQAERFAQGSSWPNKWLLQAQLLTDGGYYKRAQKLLVGLHIDQFEKEAEKLEYTFRWARINDVLGNRALAISSYKKAIDLGKDRHEQFAARSALQLGFLYERDMEQDSALNMYRFALSLKDHDYKNTIDQQAKAGVSRLSPNK